MGPKPEFLEEIAGRRTALRAELGGLLPQPRVIMWEIGCGHGHFLARYAAEFPEKFCVGVDLSSERIRRARRKSERAKLSNGHFVRAEASEFLQALPAGVTVGEIWVLFPDPWPKKRHHKNRVLQPGFFETVAGRVGEGGSLYFRTDHAEYFREVADLIPALSTWQLDLAAPWPLEHVTVFQARAPSYQSLVAVRTSHPARSGETVAPRPSAPADPKSFA